MDSLAKVVGPSRCTLLRGNLAQVQHAAGLPGCARRRRCYSRTTGTGCAVNRGGATIVVGDTLLTSLTTGATSHGSDTATAGACDTTNQ